MFAHTLDRLTCPQCHSKLSLVTSAKKQGPDIRSGELHCLKCNGIYPILGGVALLVKSVQDYFVAHAKGIALLIPDSEIPPAFLDLYLEAKSQIEIEHIEEDLEAERVVSLYFMNHYLAAGQSGSKKNPGKIKNWWKPLPGNHAPDSKMIDQLIKKFWDKGPFNTIQKWFKPFKAKSKDVLEIGCGVGGLYLKLESKCNSYLGVDSSFISIALGRHLLFGAPFKNGIRIPQDLLMPPQPLSYKPTTKHSLDCDLIVADLDALPVAKKNWDVCIALNTIDMMGDPSALPKAQKALLREGGYAFQSCPYIWHPEVAKNLRRVIPKTIRDSAQAVEWLYENAGLDIIKRIPHQPWVFFKHFRQIELYSVHLFMASLK